jgi:hypothetical protein
MKHATGLARILATRHANGADHWETPDGRIGVGSPFSTLESLLILSELGVPRSHESVKGAAKRVLDACGKMAGSGSRRSVQSIHATGGLPEGPALRAGHETLSSNTGEPGEVTQPRSGVKEIAPPVRAGK